MAAKSPNHTGRGKIACKHSLLLNQAKGNDALHNGSAVLLAPQRKLQLLDQTPRKSKVSLGKYQLPAMTSGFSLSKYLPLPFWLSHCFKHFLTPFLSLKQRDYILLFIISSSIIPKSSFKPLAQASTSNKPWHIAAKWEREGLKAYLNISFKLILVLWLVANLCIPRAAHTIYLTSAELPQ